MHSFEPLEDQLQSVGAGFEARRGWEGGGSGEEDGRAMRTAQSKGGDGGGQERIDAAENHTT